MSAPAPKRLLKKENNTPSKAPIIAAVAATLAVALAAGGYFGLCAWVKNNDRLLPGTTVSGLPDGETVDLGGMDSQEAAQLLESRLGKKLESRTMTVEYGGQSAVLEGELFSADAGAAVSAALEEKQARPFYTLGFAWLGLGRENTHSLSALSLTDSGREKVNRLADEIAQALYIPPAEDRYEIGDDAVEFIRGSDGQQVDRDALTTALTEALIAGQARYEVTPETVPAKTVTGEELSQLVYAEPQSPRRAEDGSITAPVVGRSIDPQQAQTLMDGMGPGESKSIPITLTQPDFGNEEELYQDILAQSVTFVAGTANRRTNVRLASEAVNGAIVLPGETFSYNQTVGERTAAKGYKEATVYVAGQDKDELGGGICQLASALYYCSLYADLEIVERTNHRFAVTYVPYGLDATVAWPSLDYKFKNNTNYPIKIVTSTDSKHNMTVTMYGTKENDNYVEMKTAQLSKTPYNTLYKIDESLDAGATKDEVHGYTGFKYESYRRVYDGAGKLLSNTFEASSTYAYRDRVVLVSPYDAADYGLEGGISTPPPATTPPVEVSPTAEVTPDPGVSTPPEETETPEIPWWAQPSESPSLAPDPEPVDPDPSSSPDDAVPDWLAP